MKRFLILAPALLLAVPALAQETPAAPTDGYQTLWCHIAFSTMTAMIPPFPEDQLAAAHAAGADVTPEQEALLAAEAEIGAITAGGPQLRDTAKASYVAAGFTDEQFEAAATELTAKVTEEINGPAGQAEFTYESCLALLPAPETPAAPQ